MKVGIDGYCYHRLFGEVYDGQQHPAHIMTYEDFLRRAGELKVDGVSMETCFFESFAEDYLKRLAGIIAEARLEPVVAWGHPKGFEGGLKPEAMAELKSMFRVCHILGARVMRVVGSSLDYRNDPHAPQLARLTKIFREAAQVAAGEGVKLAVENHFDFSVAEYLELLHAVDSPYFGMTFDTGNCLRAGDDPVESVRLLGKYIFATHTKDVAPIYGANPRDWFFFACTPVGQGIINMPALVDALLAEGYQGLFAVEVDYPHPCIADEDAAVAESIAYLQRLQAERRLAGTWRKVSWSQASTLLRGMRQPCPASASACWATVSWARCTLTPISRSPTASRPPRLTPTWSPSAAATRRGSATQPGACAIPVITPTGAPCWPTRASTSSTTARPTTATASPPLRRRRRASTYCVRNRWP